MRVWRCYLPREQRGGGLLGKLDFGVGVGHCLDGFDAHGNGIALVVYEPTNPSIRVVQRIRYLRMRMIVAVMNAGTDHPDDIRAGYL